MDDQRADREGGIVRTSGFAYFSFAHSFRNWEFVLFFYIVSILLVVIISTTLIDSAGGSCP